ncbi:ARC6/PARC6 family protein [Aerosakkonema funiforme]|uniref:ARC6/PARC6 family protein n=1 Tax=Aerosakkonema funiforme TaxID=1246630 RepID=UPI0035BA67CD
MNEDQEKSKLWKTYYIIFGVMIGGSVLIVSVQAAWNAIQQSMSRPAVESSPPSTRSSPSTTLSIQPPPPNSNIFTREEAVNVITRYMEAKPKIFAPPYDRQLAGSLTTGKAYDDTTKSGGQIDYLKERNAWYEYGKYQVDPTGYFEVTEGQAQIELRVTQDFYYYEYGKLKNSYNGYSKVYRFTLILENGTWKIADRNSI